MPKEPQTTNDWRETVRDIFDLLYQQNHSAAYDLKNDILDIIKKRHYKYFYEAHHEGQ